MQWARTLALPAGELIDGLSDNLHKLTSVTDYKAAPDAKKQMIDDWHRYMRIPSITLHSF